MINKSSESIRNYAVKVYYEASKKQKILQKNNSANAINNLNNLSKSVLHQGDKIETENKLSSFPTVLKNATLAIRNSEKTSRDAVNGKVDVISTMIALNNAQIATTQVTACASKITASLNTIFHMQL